MGCFFVFRILCHLLLVLSTYSERVVTSILVSLPAFDSVLDPLDCPAEKLLLVLILSLESRSTLIFLLGLASMHPPDAFRNVPNHSSTSSLFKTNLQQFQINPFKFTTTVVQQKATQFSCGRETYYSHASLTNHVSEQLRENISRH